MILTDTGPIVALLDADDDHHAARTAVARRLLAGPLLTSWPCFTEAMSLLGAVGGYRYQAELWRLWRASRLVVHDFIPAELERMSALMEKYHDTPMDLADASLIAVAETRAMRSIFTLDSDFYIYRLADGSTLEIIR